MPLTREECDNCHARAARQFSGEERDGTRQIGGYLTCLCEACADTFRRAVWTLLAAAASKRAPLKSID